MSRIRLRPEQVPIDTAMADHHLLGAALGDLATWKTWLVVLKAAYGRPLTDEERVIFESVAGGRPPPKRRVRELWAIVGRRGGKSRAAAIITTHAATLQEHALAPGETGFALTLSPTRDQADRVLEYSSALLQQSPVLRSALVDQTARELRLRGNIVIGTHPASFRSARGRTIFVTVLDECAYFRDETSAVPDIEVYRSLIPALTEDGMLVGISTGYRKVGLLWSRYEKYFGVDDPDILVVSGSSQDFNPTLNEARIAAAIRDDPEIADSEWGGGFRQDIAAFLSGDDIDACIDHDRPSELAPRAGLTYQAFSDPSGGRHDAFCLAIGHREGDRVIIDAIRGTKPPFDPKLVVQDYGTLLKSYGLREVRGDNYSAEWVVGAFKEVGIKYERADLPKSRIFIEGLPHFTRRTISLPNHPILLRELRLLERHTHVSGRDTVEHPRRGGTDDHANAVFGVMHLATKPKQRARMVLLTDGWGGGVEVDPVTLEPLDQPARSQLLKTSDGRLVLQSAPGSNGCIPTIRKRQPSAKGRY